MKGRAEIKAVTRGTKEEERSHNLRRRRWETSKENQEEAHQWKSSIVTMRTSRNERWRNWHSTRVKINPCNS